MDKNTIRRSRKRPQAVGSKKHNADWEVINRIIRECAAELGPGDALNLINAPRRAYGGVLASDE
jgi:hypothetical protein